MPNFLYEFGYEGPEEESVNRLTDWDVELSGEILIHAATAEDALNWGRRLSDWYVMRLFGDKLPGRWSAGAHAVSLEDPRAARVDLLDVSSMTPVQYGDYPNFADLHELLG